MSIRMMDQVWRDKELLSRTDLLIMLALADWSNDEGVCWPSIESIASKARCTDRSAQRRLYALVASQKLEISRNQGRGNTNSYKLYPRVTQCRGDNTGVKGDTTDPKIGPKKSSVVSPRTVRNRQEPSGIFKEDIISPKGEELSFDEETSKSKFQLEAEKLIVYLNQKAGREFSPAVNAPKLVRLLTGKVKVTSDDIRRVIDRQVAMWKTDPVMAEWLRPATLFGPQTFWKYYEDRNQPVVHRKMPRADIEKLEEELRRVRFNIEAADGQGKEVPQQWIERAQELRGILDAK